MVRPQQTQLGRVGMRPVKLTDRNGRGEPFDEVNVTLFTLPGNLASTYTNQARLLAYKYVPSLQDRILCSLPA